MQKVDSLGSYSWLVALVDFPIYKATYWSSVTYSQPFKTRLFYVPQNLTIHKADNFM